ncbi:MAG: hypothetical protein H6R10_3391 [Rhodocyclaceae bacterium]|nr:hypothetical protein [Rhodocyclaceae bacterium]
MLFVLGALRAVIELIGLCLLGQGVLHLVAGTRSGCNPIYRLFSLLTAPPRHLVRAMAPSFVSGRMIPLLTFMLLFFLWIGLAWMRTFV